METIQVQVSSELAQRLRPYQGELHRILEWGLRHLEREKYDESVLQKQIVAALHQAGAVGPDPATIVQYLTEQETHPWAPIQAGGKPASEMIIEERNSRPWVQ